MIETPISADAEGARAFDPATYVDPAGDPDARYRSDGWTPARQHGFLTRLAEGYTVEAACASVSMSVASAYALRRRLVGSAFALGWRAAQLLARDRIADLLLSRAIDGQIDTYTRADGTQVTRHRYDNRLAAAMLARLDRLADAPPVPTIGPAAVDAARLAASDWEQFTDLIGRDESGVACSLFLAARTGNPDLEPEPEPTPPDPQLPQLSEADRQAIEVCDKMGVEPVAWDDVDEQWLTWFPPPPAFTRKQYGKFGDANYRRQLSPAEQALIDHVFATRTEADRAIKTTIRDDFFGFTPDGHGDLDVVAEACASPRVVTEW